MTDDCRSKKRSKWKESLQLGGCPRNRNVVNFSLARGFSCRQSSKANTIIRNGEIGEESHLPLEIPTSGPTMGHSSQETAASIKQHDDVEATLVKGTLLYLWQHNDCPGRRNQGCYRMSTYRGIDVNDSMSLCCQLKDATIRPLATQIKDKIQTNSQDKKLDSEISPRQCPPHCHCEQTMESKYHGLR